MVGSYERCVTAVADTIPEKIGVTAFIGEGCDYEFTESLASKVFILVVPSTLAATIGFFAFVQQVGINQNSVPAITIDISKQ